MPQDLPPDTPPETPPGNDPGLMARVLAALSQEAALANLSVEFIEGTLVLRGTAGSAEARDQATDLARAAAGDAPVENRMRVG